MAKTARNFLTLVLLLAAAPLTGFAASQTIAFDAIPNQIFGVSPFVIVAQASSGLPVSFSVTTPGVCKLAGSLVMVLSAGPCFITANQGGNASFGAAAPVTQSFTVSQAKPAGTLGAATGGPFGLPSSGIALATGDFNGDGIQDIAVAGYPGITIALGNGAGGFTAGATIDTSETALPQRSIVVGDFNGDGFLDLAESDNGEDGRVTVLLGNGGGGFTPAAGSPFAVGGSPTGLVVGDFNGDGVEDLATANFGSGDVTVLLGNGLGGFTAGVEIPVPAGPGPGGPQSLAVGDFNGDGIQDLAVANQITNNVTILLGNGSGGFTASPSSPFNAGSLPYFIVAGDFNGDGTEDLAVANLFGNNVTVLLGNGAGGFSAAPGSPFAVGRFPYSVAAGDFNGDGILDLATANFNDDNVSVLLGNGLGGFTAAGNLAAATPDFLLAGDFNGDSIQDLAVTSLDSFNVTVFLGGPVATGAVLSTTSPTIIAAGQSVPLALTVSDTGMAFSAPTGTVTISDGSTVLGTASQTASPYTFTASGLGLGVHTLTAAYGGDARTSGSVSNAITIQVYQAQTITFGALSNVALGSGNVTLAATASSGLSVSYTSGTPGVCTVSGATVTLVAFGTCSITASQAGNGTYAPATSVVQAFIISPVTPSVTSITPNTAPAFSPARAVTITGSNFLSGATVSFTPPGGVTTTISPNLIQAAQIAATVPASFLTTAGTAQVVVNNGFAALSNPVSFTITPVTATNTNLVSSGNPSRFGAMVTLTATVSPAPGSGIVTFYDGVNVLGTVAVTGGSASIQTILLPAGTQAVRARYSGNATYGASVSAVLPQVVNAVAGIGVGMPLHTAGANALNGMAVGDFNGDGKADLAQAGANGITILRGKGDGTFQAGVTYAAGTASGTVPQAVAVGDFNGDGHADLVCGYGNNISVLLGNGDGTFQTAVQYAAAGPASGHGPAAVGVGDFNGDGVADIAAISEDNVTSVYLGNGDGTFAPAAGYGTSFGSLGQVTIAIGDFNGDGVADIATGDSFTGLSIRLGNGDGTFWSGAYSPGVYSAGSMGVGDFNGDGITDIAIASPEGVTILTGYGDGSFRNPVDYPGSAGATALAIGDFNGDGRIDIALPGNSGVYLLFGNGDGTFQRPAIYPADLISNALVVADFNGDGRADLAITDAGGNMDILLGAVSQTITFGPVSNAVLGSGSVTLTATASSGLAVSFASETPGICTVSGASVSLVAVGLCSIAAGQGGSSIYAVATGVTQTFVISPVAPTVTAVAPNAVPAYSGATALTITGANFISGATVSFTPPGGVAQTIAPSLIQAAQLMATIPASFLTTAGTAQVAVNDGFGAFSSPMPFTITAATQTIAFDAIPNQILGVSPFVIAAQASSLLPVSFASSTPAVCKTAANLVMLRSAGTCSITASQPGNAAYGAALPVTRNFIVKQAKVSGSFILATGSPFAAGFGQPASVVTGDFNRDGIQDLATVDFTIDGIVFGGGGISVFLGNGTGGFTQAAGSPFSVETGSVSLATGDFNGDGISDLAISGSSRGDVAVLLGNGLGGFTAVPGSPFIVGTIPEEVVVGDFNGDGIQDLATANYDSGNVTVLLGNGAGGFTAAPGSPFGAGSGTNRIAVGDFNGDGIQDLAVTNQNDNDVTVLLGNGAGGFIAAAGGPIAVGSGPTSLVVGDFNSDGIQDLAVTNENDNSIRVLLGNGVGGFAPAAGSPFAVGALPQRVRVGDFNGDGIQDLAVTNAFSNNITILLGSASGGFTPMTDSPLAMGGFAGDLAVGDFNGDGIQDIAATNNGFGGSVTVFLGTVVGTTPQTITFGALSAVNYGVAPFAISATSTSGLSVSFSSITPFVCTASGSTVTIAYTGICTIVASQAGNATYAAAATVAQSFTISIQTPTVTSVTPNATPANSQATAITIAGTNFGGAATVQFTSPGGTAQTIVPSLVQAAQLMATIPAAFLTTAGTAQVAVTNGISAFSNPVAFTITEAIQTISFDAIPNQILGGAPFVIAAQASSLSPVGFASSTPSACTTAGNLVMLLGVGTCSITANSNAATPAVRSFTVSQAKVSGSFVTAVGNPFAAGVTPRSVAVGDFNGDGIPDFAVADTDGESVRVWLGKAGGGFVQAAGNPIMTQSSPVSVAVGDFNGDGFQDLVTANPYENSLTVLLGNGSGGFSQAAGSPFAVGALPQRVRVGDFNGDGIQDLAVTNAFSINITILLGSASGGFTPMTDSPLAMGGFATDLAVGDFNGDGIQDLAVTNDDSSNVTILLGNGSGGFTPAPQSPFAVGTNPTSVAVGDFNGDGIQDLAVPNSSDGTLTVLLGDGSGGFSASAGSPFAAGVNPLAVAVADFNGDGIQDIAVTNLTSNIVKVLLGNGKGGFVEAAISPLGVGSTPIALAVADFNGDGIQDIVVANLGDENVTVLLGFVGGITPQTITFGALSSVTNGLAPFTISGSANSGLPVSFASDTAAVCSVAGATVTVIGAGTCSIIASQAGNATYAAAATVTRSFTVNGLPQTISFGALPNVPVGTAPSTLSATASSGYTVSFASNTPTVCSVSGFSGNIVTIIASGGCSITVTQAGDSTYAPAAPVTQSFTVFFNDVTAGDNDYAAINALAERGITTGCGSNGFCPNENVTRDEMAIFIVRAIYGNDNFTYTSTPYFTDVPSGTFGFKWIQKLKDLGITGGCTATTYCPGEVVTRDQMAILIIRARLGLSIAGPGPTFAYPSTPYFTDATAANEFAFPWIQRMKLDSITNGCTDTSYCPTDPVTRGEMAIFVMRGAFNEFLPAGTPMISQISPSTLVRGASGTFTVTGVNTNFVQGTTVLSPIPGVTIGAVTVTSATSLTVQLSAASNAVAQPYSVLAITGSEQDVLPNGLVLQ